MKLLSRSVLAPVVALGLSLSSCGGGGGAGPQNQSETLGEPAVPLTNAPGEASNYMAAENWISTKESYQLHALNPDRFDLERLPGSPARGKARFTVRPGDRVGNWSGERSEVVLGGNSADFQVTGLEGTEYYRLTVRLPNDWIPPEANAAGHKWGIFFQVHGPDEYGASPAIALLAEDKFCLSALGGDLATQKGRRRCFSDSTLSLGNEVDFILMVTWAIEPTGAIVVYRRDAGSKLWGEMLSLSSIPTLQYRDVPARRNHYWKAGFYRSESSHANMLWLGPVVRGRSFKQVAY